MEVYMRWLFCWITLSVLWRNAFAFVLPYGRQVDPWVWLNSMQKPPQLPPNPPAQMPPYMPPYKPVKPHMPPYMPVKPHMPPYMPVQRPPYMPPKQFFHPPSYQHFQYPQFHYYRPPYYGPVQMPVYKPWWDQQMPWGQFPNGPQANPQRVPFWNFYHGQQRPPMYPAREAPVKSYHQYQQDYYVKKPTQMPVNYQVRPQSGVQEMPMVFSDYDHEKPPSFDLESSVKGAGSGGVLQKLVMPSFQMPRGR